MKNSISRSLVVLLAAVFAMTPFAIDSYLPAIPSIANELNVDTAMISITVSIYVFGLAIGQLIGGPLSDKFGRMKVMVAGLVLFAFCSLMLTLSASVHSFWFWRILQSLGGGIAVVGVPATIRDNTEGSESAKLFALIALISMIAPSIAPSVGTTIMNLMGWHWIFIISGTLALVVAFVATRVLPKAKKRASTTTPVRYKHVFTESKALGYMVSQSFSFSVLMTFIANGAFAYMIHFGVTPEMFSALFLVNVIGVAIVNRINSYLLSHHSPETLLVKFISLQVLGTTLLVASQLIAPDNLWFAVVGFVVSISANGGIMANSNASFLKHFGQGAGIASAALGATQFFTAASISALAALLSKDSLWPIVGIMFYASLISLFGAIKANNHNGVYQVPLESET
ncbi:Bcr/CflA family drug resistance efflux transporter [Vibrio breoganii]|uniref:multidrug effflux MFS transporter n=1 Tax=Vibrio breoganii TaxID=553239 RepID=UPI000C856D58|nr:multidrug effflux MFS transporter [Vibrio breoganii]PMO93228.1 Bcr/CflA family drug resistance efflux transporter [Vibrio breoganii]